MAVRGLKVPANRQVVGHAEIAPFPADIGRSGGLRTWRGGHVLFNRHSPQLGVMEGKLRARLHGSDARGRLVRGGMKVAAEVDLAEVGAVSEHREHGVGEPNAGYERRRRGIGGAQAPALFHRRLSSSTTSLERPSTWRPPATGPQKPRSSRSTASGGCSSAPLETVHQLEFVRRAAHRQADQGAISAPVLDVELADRTAVKRPQAALASFLT